MGKILQIRVSASTFNPDQVPKRWPSLYKLAWADQPPGPERGVMELAATLADKQRLGMLPQDAAFLKPDIERAEALAQSLEAALGDWQAAKANEISDRLEDHLDELEKAAEKR